MNSLLRDELENRQTDLDLVINLTKFLQMQVGSSIEGHNDSFEINDDIINILKSVIHLMNYNQVESVLTSGIAQIYDHMADNGVGYKDLNINIQKKILSSIHKNNVNIYKVVTNDINLNISKASLNITKIFNGNVTNKTFTKMKHEYGIRVKEDMHGGNSQDLERLKKTRNDLAHGNKSFSEHGQSDSLDEFLRISYNTSLFMASTVAEFDDYIGNARYLSELNHLK